jgi:hypothetical protein
MNPRLFHSVTTEACSPKIAFRKFFAFFISPLSSSKREPRAKWLETVEAFNGESQVVSLKIEVCFIASSVAAKLCLFSAFRDTCSLAAADGLIFPF